MHKSKTVFYIAVAVVFMLVSAPVFAAISAARNITAGNLQLKWLEIYAGIFQKFAFIVLSSFFLIRFRPFQNLWQQVGAGIATRRDRIISGSMLTSLGLFAALFGFFRYGQSDWAFIDLQLVYTLITGLLCGWQIGLASALADIVCRFLLGAGSLVYVTILLTGGLTGGYFFSLYHSNRSMRWLSLAAGSTVAVLHALLTYWPLWPSVGAGVFFGILIAVVTLESLSVYSFVAVSLGFLAEKKRQALEKLVPEMKLKFLQAQINPHFLFNALNTIAAVCTREKAEGARELVIKLSNFFRRIVKQDDDWVTLEDELRHVDTYIEIEKARYQDRLKIQKEIHLEKRGFRSRLPVLIIQPIVENAIRHGIAQKTGGGVLTISASENEEVVVIQVSDNGVGMTDQKLREILASSRRPNEIDNNGAHTGIGLRNIDERLRYVFGDDYRLAITSQAGSGTTVQFKIPIAQISSEIG